MSSTTDEAIQACCAAPGRSTAWAGAGLVFTSAAAWAGVFVAMAAPLPLMRMCGTDPVLLAVDWTAARAGTTFAMWFVMMVAMMLPGATTAVVNASRLRVAEGGLRVPGLTFATGYLAVWAGFSVAATLAQWALESGRLFSQAMAIDDVFIAAPLVIAIGLYQLTGFKLDCLRRCAWGAPAGSTDSRRNMQDVLIQGMRHGFGCLGCCAPLMCLSFVAGLMNVGAMALVAAWVVAEKAFPWGGMFARLSGAALVAAGASSLAMALL